MERAVWIYDSLGQLHKEGMVESDAVLLAEIHPGYIYFFPPLDAV